MMPSPGYAKEKSVNVLILNSYHQGLEWTDDQTQGILDNLQLPSEQSIYIEYLDWKRYPTLDQLDHQSIYLESKYADQPLDLIITTDDIALKFALEHRQAIFSDAPIVFSGILESSADGLLKGHDRVQGFMKLLIQRVH